jgi:hypothetical protein
MSYSQPAIPGSTAQVRNMVDAISTGRALILCSHSLRVFFFFFAFFGTTGWGRGWGVVQVAGTVAATGTSQIPRQVPRGAKTRARESLVPNFLGGELVCLGEGEERAMGERGNGH